MKKSCEDTSFIKLPVEHPNTQSDHQHYLYHEQFATVQSAEGNNRNYRRKF
jgi:hypothetical protein